MADRNGNGRVAVDAALLELPVAQLSSAHPCHGCGDCCRYIALEIDDPTSFRDYDHMYWYLAHRGVSVYIDWEGDWFIEFQTQCRHLSAQVTCDAYEDRPRICSDFSWDECEKTTGEDAFKVKFESPEEFFSWLERRRPKAFARYRAAKRKLKQERLGTRRRGGAASPAAAR